MLIYNAGPATQPTSVDTKSNDEFFRTVGSALADANNPAILLVGGADFASWTVRSQQAPMRFDRRPSDYSQAALICEWNARDPKQSWGLEIDPVRVGAAQQLPEYAGVTPFRLGDYADTEAYPNVAIIEVPLPAERAQLVLDAARTPTRDTMRFPLMRWLAAWRAFVSLPETIPHPLLNRVPHPGAAFVAMAYEAAEVTLVPGATDLQHCPELLWANAKYWGSAVGNNVRVSRTLRDEAARVPTARPLPIPAPDRGSEDHG
jgi:hypothetical protein